MAQFVYHSSKNTFGLKVESLISVLYSTTSPDIKFYNQEIRNIKRQGAKMKRAIMIGSVIVIIDQLLKFYFQFNFEGIKILFNKNWGFTFVTNPGITLDQGITDNTVLFIQIYVMIVLVLLALVLKYYHKNYRKSIFVDLSFALFSAALLGNIIIDRMLFGGIRDYFITPIGVANLADYCGLAAFLLVTLELTLNPKFKLLKLKIKRG